MQLAESPKNVFFFFFLKSHQHFVTQPFLLSKFLSSLNHSSWLRSFSTEELVKPANRKHFQSVLWWQILIKEIHLLLLFTRASSITHLNCWHLTETYPLESDWLQVYFLSFNYTSWVFLSRAACLSPDFHGNSYC